MFDLISKCMNEPKRLTRSIIDRKIAGVCAGLARYLGVDVAVLRIIFLLSLLFGGIGFWAYLIVWLIAPEE